MRENHGHLVSFGVSHPRLELIKDKTGAAPYGLTTKLTGAGGGGCALSLIPDGMRAYSWFLSERLLLIFFSTFRIRGKCSSGTHERTIGG
jgi:mevalonate kinase